MIKKANFLILSGNGRNTGKTSFVCRVIASVSKEIPLTAIKVSPHFHPDSKLSDAIYTDEHFIISLETDPWRHKDTSRMLSAGAKKVFYIEVKDDHLEDALKAIMPSIPSDTPVICESGGMRQLIEPSIFIMLNRTGREELKAGFKKLSPLANKIIMFDGSGFDVAPELIDFDGEEWVIK